MCTAVVGYLHIGTSYYLHVALASTRSSSLHVELALHVDLALLVHVDLAIHVDLAL